MRKRLGDWLERVHDMVFGANIPSSFGKAGFVVRARQFTPGELDVDMSGRTCLITGANSGLGFSTARALAARGAQVRLLCRNEDRGQDALDRILETHPRADCSLDIVDVADGASLHDFLRGIGDEPIHVLINNAGVLPAERQETTEGHELTFATNLLGPFILIRHLRKNLERGDGRIINVSSGGMYLKRLDVDALIDPTPSSFSGVDAYANTKRALVVATEMWAHELRNTSVTVNSMHPGWVDTPAVKTSLPRFHRLTQSLLRDREQGADTIVWLAVCERLQGETGRFYFDRQPRRSHLVPWTREKARERQRLWQELWTRSGL
jgi:NAD(P)-dependent dehydrogenase (short-subunit alcohol dehydrogenase family)